jgi:hypothetical protein
MVSAIILILAIAFSIWTTVFSTTKLWWLEREKLFGPKFSTAERRARTKLWLTMLLIAMPIYLAGKSTAAHNGVDVRLWCLYAFAVGMCLTRPVCCWFWPDQIRAGDDAAEERKRAARVSGRWNWWRSSWCLLQQMTARQHEGCRQVGKQAQLLTQNPAGPNKLSHRPDKACR